MGSSASKAVNLTKALPEKETLALKNLFFNIVKSDPGHK